MRAIGDLYAANAGRRVSSFLYCTIYLRREKKEILILYFRRQLALEPILIPQEEHHHHHPLYNHLFPSADKSNLLLLYRVHLSQPHKFQENKNVNPYHLLQDLLLLLLNNPNPKINLVVKVLVLLVVAEAVVVLEAIESLILKKRNPKSLKKLQ